jgi:hypothetical protein
VTTAGPPSATIATPSDGATYAQGQVVNANYGCSPGSNGGTLKAAPDGCKGTVANGSPIDTSTVGAHAFAVTATDTDGQTVTVTSRYTVDAAIAASDLSVSATEGAKFSGQVASFTDLDTSASAGEYTASIDWGDGSATSTGKISGSGGNFAVSGDHTYADEGSHTTTVTISDVDTPSNSASATGPVSVADAAIGASGVSPSPVAPQSFNGKVANFTDANSTAGASDFNATIDWGDGSTNSPGTVSGSGSSYGVSGSHTYTTTGYFTVKVHIVDDGGSTADATTMVLIFGAVSGGNFVIGDNNAAVNTDVTFWGAQWWKKNGLSGGTPPASFKGFEDDPASASCGTTWTTDPGNSTPPPRGPLPPYMAVIVSNSISKSGPTMSGNTPHLVVVKTNSGYAADPGHSGTGTVVAQIC